MGIEYERRTKRATETDSQKLPKWVKITFLVILVPLILSVISNLLTWFATKDKIEVTFKLDGWITIGSVKYADLPTLKLMLDQQEVENILKVSWRVINTGNKGIINFESGPLIEFPEGSDIVIAKVSESSPYLKVARKLRIVGNQAFIDSLGVFNSCDFFKVDFFIKNIAEQKITKQYFKEWILSGKSLDLSFSQDVSLAREDSKSSSSMLERTYEYMQYSVIIITIIWVVMLMFFPSACKKLIRRFSNVTE